MFHVCASQRIMMLHNAYSFQKLLLLSQIVILILFCCWAITESSDKLGWLGKVAEIGGQVLKVWMSGKVASPVCIFNWHVVICPEITFLTLPLDLVFVSILIDVLQILFHWWPLENVLWVITLVNFILQWFHDHFKRIKCLFGIVMSEVITPQDENIVCAVSICLILKMIYPIFQRWSLILVESGSLSVICITDQSWCRLIPIIKNVCKDLSLLVYCIFTMELKLWLPEEL